MNAQLPPPMVIYQLASAHYISQALYVAAHLGLADLLADGAQTPEALAVKTGTHAGPSAACCGCSRPPVSSPRIPTDTSN
jgi:hypothetical protein